MSSLFRGGRRLLLATFLLVAMPASAAQANIPAPASVTMPIRVPVMNNYVIGTATLNVS